MIVSAATAADARLLAALTGPAGTGMWKRGLSADGQEPATHYISAGRIDAAFAALLPLTTVEHGEDGELIVTRTPGQPAVLAALAAQAGLNMSVERIAAVLDAADVSKQDADAALARLGVQFVQEDNPL